MNVLVLHNNNLPKFLLFSSQIENVSIKSISVALPPTDVPDFDVFIIKKLEEGSGANLKNENYDIIILPYNTTENNIEYTGLRILAHLRLTTGWSSKSTPILFIGPDTTDEVNHFCELGCLLNSFNVFKSSKNKQEDIFGMLQWIKKETKAIDNIEGTPQYKDFLKRMKSLSAPANYASHHSLANEWAIMRWNDMMTNPIQLDNKDFTSMLYYKYLRAVHGDSQQMKKWKKSNPNVGKIEGVEPGKKLVLIDDEWKKGWSQLLKHIADLSGFSFKPCPIDKKWDRKTLINEINSFIDDKENDADCYLLDLRLHDTDFDEMFLKQNNYHLSGFDVLDHIKERNEANPVVIFSASNKLWNFKDAVWNYKDPKTKEEKSGAVDFVLKETPESALKASESYMLYCDFVNAIKTSFKIAELKRIVEKQSDLKKIYPYIDSMNQFVKLVLLDRGNNKQSMLKACLMNLVTFLEEYIKERYEIVYEKKNDLLLLYELKDGGKCFGIITGHIFVKYKGGIIDDTYYTKDLTSGKLGFVDLRINDIGIMLSALYIVYGFDKDLINTSFVPLKNARNSIAHTSDEISITYDQLYDFYFKIIVPVVEQDYKKP